MVGIENAARLKFLYLGWEILSLTGQKLYVWKNLQYGFLVRTSTGHMPKERYCGIIR